MTSDETPAPAVAPHPPTPAWSITRRFTVLYLISTSVLLLVAVGFLYLTLRGSLDARDRALLTSKVHVLRYLLQEHAVKTDVLASEVEHEASGGPISYYIRILDKQGGVLLETPGMSEHLPVAAFDAPVPLLAESAGRIEPHVSRHESFLLLSDLVSAKTTGLETRILQVGLDIAPDLALLAEYRRTLLAVLVIGLLTATAVGGYLARKGVQPLEAITKSTWQVTASQLGERIVVSGWPAELTELARAFNAMLDRLEASFVRLSRFSADLAHEFRTPINNLRGEAEVALARCRTPEEYQQGLESSIEEYDRLSRLIDELLFVARAENPNAVAKRVRFDAGKEIEAVREFYEALAAEQEVDVTREGEGWGSGDPALFRRAVGNLLGNALRHTPAGGSVCISLRSLDGQSLEISVRDTGEGIAPEHLPRVFDRFYRGDSSRSHAAGGAGLGLAIVKSIMRLHGGTASVQSALGLGTTVTLVFPAATAPSPEMTET